MESWLRTAARPDVLKRGAKVGLIVGTILVAINQGDLLLAGRVTPGVFLKILLTYCVPFGVSTYASVDALREQMRRDAGR